MDRISEKELKALFAARKQAAQRKFQRRTKSWPAAVGAAGICFFISASTGLGLYQIFGENSVFPPIGGMFTLLVTGYFFSQHFKDFWDKNL